MIWGRPTNLWLGLVTALTGFVTVTLVQLGLDPAAVATVAGSGAGVLGALIVLVANQPPSVNPGGQITVHTANGEADKTATIDVAPSGRVTASTPPDPAVSTPRDRAGD